jgi:hypothetical protein
VAALFVGRAAFAAEPPPEPVRPYSSYEQQSVDDALARVGGKLDPAPRGKVIESVVVIPLEVVEPRDPIPNWLGLPKLLNALHTTTKPHVLQREVLARAGDRYRQAVIDETCRNLRSLQQTSLVLCLPVTTRSPDRVRVVIVSKDVWSLRLNSDVRFANGRIDRLVLQPTEANLAGTHQAASFIFQLDPATYSLGARYSVPRLVGSRTMATIEASAIMNRESGKTEGSYGGLSYGQPLYSMQTRWAWMANLQWRHDVYRRFVAGELASFESDELRTPTDIAYQYRQDLISGSYGVTRSFGAVTKHNVTVGLMADRRAFHTFDLSSYPRAEVEVFLREAVPVSDTRVGPFIEYKTYTARYTRVLDFNTLGLQEDYRLGHELILRVMPVVQALGSSRDLVSVFAAAAYTWPLGDGLVRTFVETQTDAEPSRIADGSVTAGGRVATPSTKGGRLIFDARVVDRYRDYLHQHSVLGGDTRLRGYPSQAFIGRDMVVGNLEYRTPSVDVFSVEVGGAAFFDTGDAFDSFDSMRLKQGAGFGLRALVPMLDRVVLRADWGFPLSRWYVPPVKSSFPGELVITFRQAFPQPSIPTSSE